MINDVGFILSRLCILIRILRHNIGANFFEPEIKMKALSRKMIPPRFG